MLGPRPAFRARLSAVTSKRHKDATVLFLWGKGFRPQRHRPNNKQFFDLGSVCGVDRTTVPRDWVFMGVLWLSICTWQGLCE